jgi:hypothetical protein
MQKYLRADVLLSVTLLVFFARNKPKYSFSLWISPSFHCTKKLFGFSFGASAEKRKIAITVTARGLMLKFH